MTSSKSASDACVDTETKRTVILIPCHNRKLITLSCLSQLRSLGILEKFSVIIVDDGSSDGTSDAVSSEFPEVLILRGDGELFWTGAMEKAMRHAISMDAECCVWLNDDLSLGNQALEQVVAKALVHQTLVSGQGVIDLENGSKWYFPLLYKGISCIDAVEFDPHTSVPTKVDTCRGNLVAIPKNVILKIGYPDGKNIPHVGGDSDYGLRATAAGFECLTLGSALFFEKETVRNDNRSWLLGKRPITKIWSLSLSRRGNLYPRMVLCYNVRHWGIRGFCTFLRAYLRLAAITLLRVLIPAKILHFCFANYSHAYLTYEGRPGESSDY